MKPLSLLILLSQFISGRSILFKNPLALNLTCNIENLPCLDLEEWWGPYDKKGYQDTRIRPFRIHFDDEMIEDLRYRLKYHRKFIPPLQGTRFQYGFNTKVLTDWVHYWAKEYPFKERERFLNNYPMYKTNIQGLDMFFVWVKPEVPPGKHSVPILLLHGWPGSFREFYEAIPLLTAADDSRDFVLELIIPSLPGFGYSDAAVRPGLGAAQAAVVLRNLMNRLGFKRYYVQGGDFGSITGSLLATMFPKEVLGFHTNWPFIFHPTARMMHLLAAVYPPLIVDPALAYRFYPLYDYLSWLVLESGYLHEQATKPDTIGVGISDSPSGLMAYNLYQFNLLLGTRGSDDLDNVPRDSLIDHIMLYWAPNAVTTSFRYYAETFNKRHFGLGLDLIPCQVPVWVIQAENEATYDSPPMLKIKFPYLVNVTAIHYGGHFLAFETSGVYSNDVLTAIASFRNLRRYGQLSTSLQPEYYWEIDSKDLWRAMFNILDNIDVKWLLILLNFAFQALLRLLKRVVNYISFDGLVAKLLN